MLVLAASLSLLSAVTLSSPTAPPAAATLDEMPRTASIVAGGCMSCTCVRPDYDDPAEAVTEALTSAQAVFVAEVVEIRAPGGELCDRAEGCGDQVPRGAVTLVSPGDVTVTLAIESAWKGVDGDQATIAITTHNQESACGYPFEIGRAYLVYAYDHEDEGSLSTNYCARTKPAEEAGFDLRILGR